MRVLTLAAHPDDEILGVGATLARHAAAGDDVIAVVVAEGASTRYGAEAGATQRQAGEKAAAILGLKEIRFLGLRDQHLDEQPILEINQLVEKQVDELRPDVVYVHHWGDLNRDHRVVAEAAMVACRPVGAAYPRRLYCFETPSSTEWSPPDLAMQFVPTVFVDVTAHLDAKLAAMACYADEVRPAPHPRSLEALRARAAYWGQIVGVAYAEAFVLAREVIR